VAGVTGPNDPPQPYQPYDQPSYPQPGYPQPGYPQPGYQQPGYQQPAYQQPGYPQWPGDDKPAAPRRPGVLIAAGVLWLVIAAFLILVGVVTSVADQIPGFNDAMRQQGITVTPEQLRTLGFLQIAFGVLIGALGVLVFRGSLWARIAVVVVAAVPGLLFSRTLFFPLLVIAAAVLQFLPAANAYAQDRRRAYRPQL
jgi:hypothetical protein